MANDTQPPPTHPFLISTDSKERAAAIVTTAGCLAGGRGFIVTAEVAYKSFFGQL